MMTLIVLACLARDPTHCERHAIGTDGCQGLAWQVAWVRWVETHPGWVFKRTLGCGEGEPA